MKIFYLLLLTTSSVLFSSAQNINSVTGNDNVWKEKAIEELQKSEHRFVKHKGNSFKSFNKSNNLQIVLSSSGYSLTHFAKQENTIDWKANFSIITIGRKKLEEQVASIEQISSNNLFYHYSGFSVEYKNLPEGLRQNFIINKKHSKGDIEQVAIQIKSELHASIAEGDKLLLKDAAGKTKLAYDGLRVWDANNKVLPAGMQLNAAGELEINVNTKDAVYPITIDPLNHTPEWTTSADGILPGLLNNLALQVNTLYGFNVAGLGDINGDGYDDVAISAPTMADVISGTGTLTSVGAVFVYLGSPTGLPITPNHVLQPTTAVTGALFGFSVTGGDVTGDGINDIIVGAPLDRVQATISGLANAKVGKVYIYQGGATLTGQNPTPLLNIHLDAPLLVSTTVILNPLFGFSVAVADDMNGDGKGEIVVGAPAYARVQGSSAVKTGGAFVFLSDASNAFATIKSLTPPTGSLLGLSSTLQTILGPILWNTLVLLGVDDLLDGQIEGLLFGFSVDGTGDYNNDGNKDVVVGAPAGVNLGSLNNLLNGQILGGSAYVFGGNGTGINTTSLAKLQATSTGLLSNAANLFGYSVRGVKDAAGNRNGNILAGAPVGAVINNVLGLKVQAGQLHVFKKKLSAPSSPVSSDQVIASPRANSILALLTGQTLSLSVLYASSIDNMLDVNCDGIGDIIVGEPLSTSVGLLNADAVGGAAYVYLGQSNGSYVASPYWTLTSEVSPVLGINATALLGYSVAGAGHVKGASQGVRALVGGPANSLDFGIGLLNLGNTLGTLLDFTFDNNGLGKAYTFAFNSCGDNDKDGIPDVIDVDDDNDGIPDRFEFAQSDNSYAQPATDPSADDDGDGIPNYKDADYTNCNSLNANGICNGFDKDGDGIPNHFDLDSDNDGLQDIIEAGGHDANGDGRVDCTVGCDADNDGLLSPVDLTTTTDAYATVHSKLSNGSVAGTTSGRMLDTDSDGVPDFLDIDSDNDGIFDLIETGGADANGDGRVDFSGSFSSVDSDGDGWINHYDADTNNDGDVTDAGEGTAKALIISSDTNNDNLADAWSDGPSPDKFPVDFDGDARPNYRDLDSDSDGINDVLEAGGADPDGNGLIGTGSPVVNTHGYAYADLTSPLISTDPDTNSDGRPDDDNDLYQTPYHNGGGGTPSNFNPDQDGDSRPNFLDLDSDNDSINDIIEGRVDRNNDGIPDTQGQDTDEDGLIDNKTDVDRDGIADVVDFIDNQYGDGKSPSSTGGPVNTDGPDPNSDRPDSDNVPDYLDLDSDNDGVFDTKESGNPGMDQNGDGIIDCDGNVYTSCDPDLDGILEKVDGKPAVIGDAPGNPLPNTDGTDNEDYRDTNSDNDDTSNDDNYDTVEKRGLDEDEDDDGRVDGTDTDGDGIINIPSIDNNNIFGGNEISTTPLPVHLISFSGKDKDQKVQLSWIIENEVNFKHYELERSNDGTGFSSVAIVLPYGRAERNTYGYTDNLSGKSGEIFYYRLKMVDMDGSFSYSPVLVFRTAAATARISIYPNPAIADFVIRLEGLKEAKYTLELVSTTGEVQLSKQIQPGTAYSETIYRKGMPAGLYIIRLRGMESGKVETRSIILQ